MSMQDLSAIDSAIRGPAMTTQLMHCHRNSKHDRMSARHKFGCMVAAIVALCAVTAWTNIATAENLTDLERCKKEVFGDQIVEVGIAGSFQLAIQYCTQAVESNELSDPDMYHALNARATAYATAGKYDLAIADFNRAIELDASRPAAYNGRGYAYDNKGMHDRAILDYDEALRLDPNLAVAYCNRGNAFARKGMYDRAIANFDKAIILSSSYATAYSNRGSAYYFQGEYGRAVADFDKAIELNPANALTYALRGAANFNESHFTKAIGDFAIAAKKDPADSYAAIWHYLAEGRAGRDGLPWLGSTATRLRLSSWPGPIVQIILGQTTVTEVADLVERSEPSLREAQQCEFNFYVAEWILATGKNQASATKMLRDAAQNCPKSFLEYGGAVSELRRLGL